MVSRLVAVGVAADCGGVCHVHCQVHGPTPDTALGLEILHVLHERNRKHSS